MTTIYYTTGRGPPLILQVRPEVGLVSRTTVCAGSARQDLPS
jgi:hypothetical protein